MNLKGIVLFDIDGVIRDVSSSYRKAIQETVSYFTQWSPSISDIDLLKEEGCWNNDWEASLELIKRYQLKLSRANTIPDLKKVIRVFNSFYFGGDPEGNPSQWGGFIKNETLLAKKELFERLDSQGIRWGFVSGAEAPSAQFVINKRLGLNKAPLIAMGDAPDKPNPIGLIRLATQLAGQKLGEGIVPIAYLGDTVADVLTIINARKIIPSQTFISLAIAPPHLHSKSLIQAREKYEYRLKESGADIIIKNNYDILSEFIFQ